MISRVYVAADSTGKIERLVRAHHPGQALRHVFGVRVASQADLERLLTRGTRVEDATRAAQPEQLPELLTAT
jgi:hypothetical protein